MIDMAKNRSIHTKMDEVDAMMDPIHVNLGGNRLMYENHSWMLENSAENQWREQVEALEEELKIVREENQIVKEKLDRTNEESNLIKFKNQLLVEMLAIATLDEEKREDDMALEKQRSNALTVELKNIVEKAHTQGIDLDIPVQ